MKTIYPHNYYLRTGIAILLFTAFILQSCMSSINLRVMEPAELTVPQHIKTITVADRVRPSKSNKVWNILEGILTSEFPRDDRVGAIACLDGFRAQLSATERFTVIQPGNLNLTGTGTGALPDPLAWPAVENICKNNNSDALLTIEAFDSDASKEFNKKSTTLKSKIDGKDSIVTTYQTVLHMRVTTAWRLYDVKNKTIYDQYRTIKETDFVGEGRTQAEANSKLPFKRDPISHLGYISGEEFARRIAPYWVWVNRGYYKKGNDNFKKAKRFAKVKDWEGAGEIWKKEAQNSKAKLAGRACYNMALYSEIYGNLDIALEWANKSYKEFGNKKARHYVYTLQQRKAALSKLDQQLNTGEKKTE